MPSPVLSALPRLRHWSLPIISRVDTTLPTPSTQEKRLVGSTELAQWTVQHPVHFFCAKNIFSLWIQVCICPFIKIQLRGALDIIPFFKHLWSIKNKEAPGPKAGLSIEELKVWRKTEFWHQKENSKVEEGRKGQWDGKRTDVDQGIKRVLRPPSEKDGVGGPGHL